MVTGPREWKFSEEMINPGFFSFTFTSETILNFKLNRIPKSRYDPIFYVFLQLPKRMEFVEVYDGPRNLVVQEIVSCHSFSENSFEFGFCHKNQGPT